MEDMLVALVIGLLQPNDLYPHSSRSKSRTTMSDYAPLDPSVSSLTGRYGRAASLLPCFTYSDSDAWSSIKVEESTAMLGLVLMLAVVGQLLAFEARLPSMILQSNC